MAPVAKLPYGFEDKSPEEHRSNAVKLGDMVEKRYRKLQAAFEGGGDDISANIFSVKQTNAMTEILTDIGKVRDLSECLLKGRRGENVEKCDKVLKKVFAEDGCRLISQLRVFIDGAKELMGESQYGRDYRLADCLKQLTSIEDVLKQLPEVEEELIEAQDEVQSARAKPLSEEQVKTLLEEIDEADDPDEMIEKVFDSYALPGEDVVRGEGKRRLTQVVAEHVSRESKERASRLKIPIFALEPSQCEGFVERCLDPNGDGSVTREEAKEGLAYALNDIDPRRDVQRRTSALDANRMTPSGVRPS